MKQDPEDAENIAIKSEDINLYRPFEAFALQTIPSNLIKVNVSLEMTRIKKVGPLSFWRLFYYDLHLSVVDNIA